MPPPRDSRRPSPIVVATIVLLLAWFGALPARSASSAGGALLSRTGSGQADRPAQTPDPDAATRKAAVVLPVDGPLLADFDPPADPYGAGHRGVDLGAEPGTAVRATLDGTVAFSGLVAGRGWVTVRHGGGLETTYGVLEPRRVQAGQRVRSGDVLGLLAPAAAHLDWGARLDGTYIDPLGLLVSWEIHLVPVTSKQAGATRGGAATASGDVYAPPRSVIPGPSLLPRHRDRIGAV